MSEIETLPGLAPIRIETKRLTIAPFGEERLTERYVSWLNDPEVVAQSVLRFRNHTIETCRAYLTSFQGSDDQFLAIVCKSDELGHIGNMTIRVDARNGLADLSILIGEKRAWGKGFAAEAWMAVCDHLLQSGAVRKVTAGTLATNTRMLELMRRVGMEDDGRRKDHMIVEGRPVDVIFAALFRDPGGTR